jgi:leucyl aminopeptidase
MKIRTAPALDPNTELAIVLAVDGETLDAGPALKDAVAAAKATGDLKTTARSVSSFHPLLGGKPGAGGKAGSKAAGRGAALKRLLFVGAGKTKDLDSERLRRLAAVAQAAAEDCGAQSFTLCIPGAAIGKLPAERAGAVIAEGLLLGHYRYQPPQKDKPKARKGDDCTVVLVGGDQKAFQRGVALGRLDADATVFARDLENQPSNLCTPTTLANAGRKLAGNGVRVKVLDVAAMKRLGMGALLGVARGSSEPPKFIVFEYGPATAKETLVVVGKGLTFDSGGISIKPAAKMDEMRYDMCGAGAVLGLFHALRHGAVPRSSRRRIVGLIAAAENMPGPDAQKPGDVVRAMDGHTIEVLNTDAEGRLVLADAMAYAKKFYKPAQIVDLATLTGAVVVALGHEVAAVLGNDQKLIDALVAAGKQADEPLWQLPLWDVHKDQMKSKFADLANINGGQGGGTIAGAAFLSFFAGDTAWAHLDIAGSAWGGISKDYYRNGACGTAVRTLLAWLRSA